MEKQKQNLYGKQQKLSEKIQSQLKVNKNIVTTSKTYGETTKTDRKLAKPEETQQKLSENK